MKIMISIILLTSVFHSVFAIDFDYKKIDSITIKSILFGALTFDRYSVKKSKFDILHSDSKMNPITILKNKDSIILFCSIINNLKEEDIILEQDVVYYQYKLKKLSDTITIKQDIVNNRIKAKELVKIKNNYYLLYPRRLDPLEVRCKIDIYQKDCHYVLWGSDKYIDIENKRYSTSKILSEIIKLFDSQYKEVNKETIWDKNNRNNKETLKFGIEDFTEPNF